MPNQTSLEQIELAELTQAVDDARVATDPFKLIAATRTLLNDRLADLKAKDAATLTTEAGRATASANLRAALDQLRTLLRDGFNFIQGLGSFAISDADRLGVKVGTAPPASASELQYLATDTRTPYVAEYDPADAGKTAYYWLRWENTKGQPGPWSVTASATITG